jgi:regulator of sigma E protease
MTAKARLIFLSFMIFATFVMLGPDKGMHLLWSVAAFIVIISIIVFIHEGGHYLIAKWAGVKIEIFSLGFGNEVFGWNDKSGTRWRVSSLPLGGYVKMFGDASEASTPLEEIEHMSNEDKKKTFHYQPLYKKAAIVVAGPAFNFLLTIVILTGMIFTRGLDSTEPVVRDLAKGMPAEAAGIKPGDRVLNIGGQKVDYFSDISRILITNTGKPVEIEIRRGEKTIPITVTPVLVHDKDPFGNDEALPKIGISSSMNFHTVSFPQAIAGATRKTYELCSTTLRVVGQIITGERAAKDIIKGPLGMAKLSGQAAELGFDHTILLMALISANLGLVNLFPIPMLDGGYLLFYAIEAIRGKPPGKRFQEYGMRIGMALIVMLMAFAVLNDIRGWLVTVASK